MDESLSPVDESLSPVEESPAVENSVPPTEESLQDDSGSETEASDTAETPNQWMQETERMLHTISETPQETLGLENTI